MVLYRTIFYFPNIVSLTVVGIIWSFVFHPNVGIVNKILGAVGLESLQRSWLGDSKTALWCIAFTLLWQAAGYYMVMHIAAMDGISPEIYESATLDGASAWRKLVSITMPLMKDIIGITFVLALSGTINLSFVLSQVMTGGGPNGASSVLLQYMYTQGFVNGNFGYAMAITVFTLAISVALSMLSRKLTDASEEVSNMTQNEKSKSSKGLKWVTRLFLNFGCHYHAVPSGVERRFFVQNQYRVSDGTPLHGRRDLHGITTSALMKNLTLLPTSATRFMSCWKRWSLLWSALCRVPTALCGISSPVRS